MTAQDLTKEQLQKFFDQPGINKTGICDGAKVSIRTLNNVIAGGRMINGQWKKVKPYRQPKSKTTARNATLRF